MTSTTHRMFTRVMVVVHSHHHEDPVHMSTDVLSFKSTKTIKGVGSLSLDVVPRKNYFNLIYPNDVINVYVDPGDGKRGFVRLFMGYIDKVERTEVTDERGGVSSGFRIVCSDFQKAFDRTSIQVNPHIQDRRNLVIEEYLVSGSPSGLMTTGVRAHGSPADMLENLTNMLLGFGKQWVLPTSYDTTSKVVADNRQRRVHRAKDRVSDEAIAGLAALLGGLIESTDQTLLEFKNFGEVEERINKNNVPQGKDAKGIEALDSEFEKTLENDDVVQRGALNPDMFAKIRGGREALRSYFVTLKDITSEVHTLLDLLDLSFIEASAIDGYIQDNSIWIEGGSLLSIMKKFSNEMMNEMIFDLRPVALSGQQTSLDRSKYLDRCFGEQYYTGKDELGLNHGYVEDGDATFKSSVQAVAYVPAIVFREYPWACVEGVDMGELTATNNKPLGFVPFGPIFSQQGISGDDQFRAIYDYNDVEEIRNGTLTVSALGCNFNGPPLKHIDVVTIRDTDVVASTLGRSDNDVVNFFTMFAEDGLSSIYKNIMKEFMPVTNPISIARNGLRVQEHTSRFATYGRDALCDGAEGQPQGQTVRNMVRWLLLKDHWEQHNIEYLTGEITLRGMPEIRVGYRLDWENRNESYYVESVSHSWAFGKEMITSIQVSRGQRNDPFLAYIPPKSTTLTTSNLQRIEGGDRGKDGRLAEFFEVLNTPATMRSTQATRTEDRTDNRLNKSKDQAPNPYSGNVIYCDGVRDSAKDISNLIKNKAKTPMSNPGRRTLTVVEGEHFSTTTEPLPQEVPDTAKFKRASRNYDDIFEKYGGRLGNIKFTVPFLRALSKRESSLNPLNAVGPAWGLMQVGIDGFPDSAYPPNQPEHPFFITKKGKKKKSSSGKVLIEYNDNFNTSHQPGDVLEPDLNVNIATELLARIVKIHKSKGLVENWNSREWVGILVAGWNAGYSKVAGTSRMIEYLVANGHDLTLRNIHFLAPDARVDGINITKHLSTTKKYNWWISVVDMYFQDK